MEKEELSYIFENNGSLLSQYQQIHYDSAKKWEKWLLSSTTTT